MDEWVGTCRLDYFFPLHLSGEVTRDISFRYAIRVYPSVAELTPYQLGISQEKSKRDEIRVHVLHVQRTLVCR